jgi:hypothetical protein
MFVTTHAAIGALIAQQIPGHPYAAFALGVASHFVSDIIPHGDTNLYKQFISGRKVKRSVAYAVIDGVLAVMFAIFMLNTASNGARLSMSLGMIGGMLPDLVVAIYEVFKFKWLERLHRIHFYFHNLISNHHDMSFAAGFSMQVVFLAGLLSVIL